MSKTTSKKLKQKEMTPAEQSFLVSGRVQLEDVRLIKSISYMEPEALQGEKEFKITHTTRVLPDEEKNQIIVFVSFKFKSFSIDKPDKQIIGIAAEFLLTYTISGFEGLTDKGIKEFGNLNGVFNAWPYWREFIQNTIARMNLPPLTIPVFRIFTSKKLKNKGDAKTKSLPKKKRPKSSSSK
jgi:hypothetical protein